jgi:hypothetical protein
MMSSFRRKLARLAATTTTGSPAVASEASRGPASQPSASLDPSSPSGQSSAPLGAPGSSLDAHRSSEHLDRLRDRLAGALHRGTRGQGRKRRIEGVPIDRPPPVLLGDTDGTLETLAEPTPWGACHTIRKTYGSDHPVGLATLGQALEASPALLSLLGLTPAVAGCAMAGALFLDTETTGLGTGTGNLPFLIGLSWYDQPAKRFVLEQLFLRDPDDEVAMLERVRQRVEACELIVSYNGKAFDMPVLRNRLIMNQLAPLPERVELDLLHLARRVHIRRTWRKSLTVVEHQILGYARGPDIAGEEVAQRYLHYLRSGAEGGLAAVVAHNDSDVLSLVALLGLYGEPLEGTPRAITPPSPSATRPTAHRGAVELAAMARVMKRAGDLDAALGMADLAIHRGAGAEGRRTRGEIAKARGDKRQALTDFEAYAEQESDPYVRLELAKLYEHFLHAPERALQVVELGTAEDEPKDAHRRARLRRKALAKAQSSAPSRNR